MPGRSIAVDRQHEYGTPFFIDAKLPVESTKRVSSFRRLMIAQDTGSAIVGPARADLYLGAGNDAARIAGRIRHSGRFVMLLPRELDMIAAGRQMPLPAPKPKISEFVDVNKQEQRNVDSADENWQRHVLTRNPARGECATGPGMDCGGKSVSVSVMSPSTQRGRAGSNQEQQRHQGMHGRGRDQPVTAGRGPQQKQPAQTTERRVPQQKQPPPATEGRGG